MNDDLLNDHDYDTAHYAALNRMPIEYRDAGQLNCTDYLIEYHNQVGESSPSVSPELIHALDAMPIIRSDLMEMDLIEQAFQRSHLEVPLGIYDLPLFWGRAIRELMLETHWPEYSTCKIKDVFGWSSVFRFGPFLHLCFDTPFSSEQSHWCEIGTLIHELHRRFEPGPYTPKGRICEFSV